MTDTKQSAEGGSPGTLPHGSGVKPSEVLSRAADLIEPEGAWTQGHYARDMFGSGVFYDSESAECWCVVGAVSLSGGGDKVLARLATTIDAGYTPPDVATWNDQLGRTQAEVVAALRKAAELAREAGQ